MFKKSISYSIPQFLEVINPTYETLQLIPDTSIRNYDSSNIAKSMIFMRKRLEQSIKLDKHKIKYEKPVKISFFIDMSKHSVNFYFVVPKLYINIIKEQCINTWDRITIKEVDSINMFTDKAYKYQVHYQREDPLSLKIDKRCNEPLNHILGTLEIMEEDDRVGILYNFLPCPQKSWPEEFDKTIEKYNSYQLVDKLQFSKSYLAKALFFGLIKTIDSALQAVSRALSTNEQTKSLSLFDASAISGLQRALVGNQRKISYNTRSKREKNIINTQIVVLSDSSDKSRKKQNVESTCEAFKILDEDNKLIYKKLNDKIVVNFNDYRVKGTITNKMSTDECRMLLELPGRNLLNEHGNIEKIDILEHPVPEELQKGVMCIGSSTYKGISQKAYLNTDKEYRNLTLCIVGPPRAGKTALITNLSKDAVDHGECTILFDFCGNCELSMDVSSKFNTEKVLTIDCSNFSTLQGLGYNEIDSESDDPFELYWCAKAKTSQLMALINSINSDDSDLRSRMERYLEAAAVVTFLQNGPIKDVFTLLQDHIIRHRYIDNIQESQEDKLEEYINALLELDEWSRETKNNPAEIVGTKMGGVSGILNRVSKLKQNAFMELMLKKDCKDNINLLSEIQKPQLICIKMPEVMFSTEQEKDIYCTYWLTKIWGTLQKRKSLYNTVEIFQSNAIKVNIVFDELYQVESCQELLRSKLNQVAKFICKPIISCHYLGQIPNIKNELKASNSSYMLISGCGKDVFKELKEELDPYELEHLIKLKRYYSLNLIRYENGWARFITHLPLPI
jgi:hypothetical protein